MKKLLLFLLLIPVLLSAQRVDYYPKRDSTWKVVRTVGFAVLLPDNYNTSKKWPFKIAIHGIGERSAGTMDNLKNLVLGFDYNNDGFREGSGLVTEDMRKAVNIYGVVLVVPTYESTEFFEPALINYVYDFIQANYSVVPKMLLTGFSYGGGATIKYITSTLANAARVAYAIPCAPTRNIVDASVLKSEGVPVHIFVNDNDNNSSTNLSVTKGIVSTLNIGNLVIYTAFRKDGHGGNVEAWSLTPPKAPGGQGFIDAAENVYQVYLDILANGPRQMKSGSAVIVQPPPPTTITTKAIVSFTLTGNIVRLDGSKSTGYTTGLDGVWELASAPAGLYSWDVFLKGSSYIVADATLTKPGAYSFRFKLKGDPEVKTVDINFGKTFVAFDSATDLITYSDGTTQRGAAYYSNGKWVVKTDAGVIIQ
jgi:dienelactone hydrolase